MADMNQLLRQAQLMQEKMQKAQEEQAKQLVTGESSAGLNLPPGFKLPF